MVIPVLLVNHARLAGLLEPHRDHLALPVGRGAARDLPLATFGIDHAVSSGSSTSPRFRVGRCASLSESART
jgi:hypothetical protein